MIEEEGGRMTECPVTSVECENCDYRYVRSIDYSARLICQLCDNWDGEKEECPTTEELIRKIWNGE